MKPCFHGGAFWSAVDLARPSDRLAMVNADVLDAWFPPAPSVREALAELGEWAWQTSPPTHAEPLEAAIGQAFGVDPTTVLAGPGSSSLIYVALARWLNPSSRVLVIEPSYGEYSHVCEQVIGCRVERMVVSDEAPFDLVRWAEKAAEFDLAVLVNPNNPLGDVISTHRLAEALPKRTRLLVDEAYLAYTGEASLAPVAVATANVAVLRSFSKSHALSGLRTAALFACPDTIAALRRWSPPWWVSLPAQVATLAALPETGYYAARYAETHRMRHELARALPFDVREGAANWVLLRLPDDGPAAEAVVKRCGARNVFVRDAGRTGPSLGTHMLRIAVKEDHAPIVAAIEEACGCPPASKLSYGDDLVQRSALLRGARRA